MSALMAVNLTIAPVVADSDSGKAPTFTKGKFAVPISHENVKQDWAARGYSNPKIESYPQGWSRGEHTHPVSLIMTLLTGRMEFTRATCRVEDRLAELRVHHVHGKLRDRPRRVVLGFCCR
jgi:hypothetical protein